MSIYPESPLILTLDIGSSSTRASLFDRTGRPVEGMMAQEHYQLRTASDGTSEIDADFLLSYVEQAIEGLLHRAGALTSSIGAVAVDTFVANLLGVDQAGQPLTPLITYADTRNSEDAATLRSHLDEYEVQQRTGGLLRSSYAAARLAWFRRTQPDVWRKATQWITFGEYLEWKWFGQRRVTFSVASWSGLLNRHTLMWDESLLASVGSSPSYFSPLVDHHESLQGLLPPYSSRWKPLNHIPWFPAIGDGAAANVGSGCTRHDRMALTIGTTGAIRVVQKESKNVPTGLWCYRINREYHLVGGATSEGGNVYAWLRQTLKLDDPDALEAALSSLSPDAHGLTILPFWAGERSPEWAGNIPATIHGMTLATTPVQLLQASLEAIAYRCALIEKRLCEEDACHHRLIASGGALLNSPTWMQMMADVMGRPVVASAEPEATSRGTALLALLALGIVSSLEHIPARDGDVYEPDQKRHEIYQAGIMRQQVLYQRLLSFT